MPWSICMICWLNKQYMMVSYNDDAKGLNLMWVLLTLMTWMIKMLKCISEMDYDKASNKAMWCLAGYESCSPFIQNRNRVQNTVIPCVILKVSNFLSAQNSKGGEFWDHCKDTFRSDSSCINFDFVPSVKSEKLWSFI